MGAAPAKQLPYYTGSFKKNEKIDCMSNEGHTVTGSNALNDVSSSPESRVMNDAG